MFAKIFEKTRDVNTLIEFGSNRGLNLHAIKTIKPNIKLSAVEINKEAVEHLKKIDKLKVYNESILEYENEDTYDFALIKGVLIHINPEFLDKVYELLYKSSKKYICVMEYYNPTPVEVTYRGEKDKLFKRDFAGEMLDKYPDLKLVDYGFVYHRDNNFPSDDGTWFLLEKC